MDEQKDEQKIKFATASFISIAFLLVGFWGGVWWNKYQEPEFNPISATILNSESDVLPESVDFSAFWKAWAILDQKYVSASSTEVHDPQDRVWGAIAGMTASFNDPYTVFFPPVESEKFQEEISGNFEGVGMEVGIRDGLLTVIAPLRGTPAERAGVLSGDIIIRIDDVLATEKTIEEAVRMIRGERGTVVTLTVAREGNDEPIEIPITRDVIDIPTLTTELRDDGVFVISLFNFSAPSSNLFRNAVREFTQSGATKLVIDLRDNPGGYLESSVEMVSYFIPEGKVVVKEDFGDGKVQEFRSLGNKLFITNPEIVILINRGSASASEIFAGALSEYGVATLVGERTFGKGSVQELVDITDSTSLKVTVAQWVTPKGTSISNGGLVPDVEVKQDPEDLENGIDTQLERAVEILTKVQ
ncbi:MAG: S41 family peptidase [Candidatus Paceibacterota bacterium]